MAILIGNARPDPSSLSQMQERGGTWAAYQNHDLSSADCGRLVFLQFGEGHTFSTPPTRYPDTPSVGLGWRYLHVGTVDLSTGDILPHIIVA